MLTCSLRITHLGLDSKVKSGTRPHAPLPIITASAQTKLLAARGLCASDVTHQIPSWTVDPRGKLASVFLGRQLPCSPGSFLYLPASPHPVRLESPSKVGRILLGSMPDLSGQKRVPRTQPEFLKSVMTCHILLSALQKLLSLLG